jgi:hypothetical protein
MNIDKCKSYAKEETLAAKLADLGIDDYRHLVVRNREGRWTAVFPISQSRDILDCMAPAHMGFMVIG